MKPYLSVIIPAFNEEKRLPPTLEEIGAFLSAAPYASEVIVVNDGSTDGTSSVARGFSDRIENLTVIDQENMGKGGAVRRGMLAAKGEIRLFMDADNSTSIDQVEKMWPHFERGCSVVMGSRDIEGAMLIPPQKWYKRLLGDLGNLVVQALLLPGIWDTQCGFKAFTAEAAEEIFSIIETEGWGFDVEALTLARRMGYAMSQIPVVWVDKSSSHVRPWTYLVVLAEVFEIKWRLMGFHKDARGKTRG